MLNANKIITIETYAELDESIHNFIKGLTYTVNHTDKSQLIYKLKVLRTEGIHIDISQLRTCIYNKLINAKFVDYDVSIFKLDYVHYTTYEIIVDWLHLKYRIPLKHKYIIGDVHSIYKSVEKAHSIGLNELTYSLDNLRIDISEKSINILKNTLENMDFLVEVMKDNLNIKIKW